MSQDWRPLTLVTQVGLTIAVTLLLSLLLGLWLDSLLHTSPLLTLVFSLVGIVAGTISVYRMVSEAIAESVAHRGPGYHPERVDDEAPPEADSGPGEAPGGSGEPDDWDAADELDAEPWWEPDDSDAAREDAAGDAQSRPTREGARSPRDEAQGQGDEEVR